MAELKSKFFVTSKEMLVSSLKRVKLPRLQFSEGGVVEDPTKPYITIDGVQVFVEDLPEEGQQIFGRLQRLNQKKANVTLDLEELQAGINFFSNKIVEIYSSDVPEQTSEAEAEIVEEES